MSDDTSEIGHLESVVLGLMKKFDCRIRWHEAHHGIPDEREIASPFISSYRTFDTFSGEIKRSPK